MFLGLQKTVTMTAMTAIGSTPWPEKNKILPKYRVTLNEGLSVENSGVNRKKKPTVKPKPKNTPKPTVLCLQALAAGIHPPLPEIKPIITAVLCCYLLLRLSHSFSMEKKKLQLDSVQIAISDPGTFFTQPSTCKGYQTSSPASPANTNTQKFASFSPWDWNTCHMVASWE